MAKKSQPNIKDTHLDLVRRILGGLNSLWGKIGIVSILFIVGFKVGCIYQEVILNKEFDDLNNKYNKDLLDVKIEFNEKIFELMEKYGKPELKKEIIELKHEK